MWGCASCLAMQNPWMVERRDVCCRGCWACQAFRALLWYCMFGDIVDTLQALPCHEHVCCSKQWLHPGCNPRVCGVVGRVHRKTFCWPSAFAWGRLMCWKSSTVCFCARVVSICLLCSALDCLWKQACARMNARDSRLAVRFLRKSCK